MFERFTNQARQVVIGAVREAGQARATQIDVEHLAIALLRTPGTRTAELLGSAAAPLADELADAYLAAARRGGLSDTETNALRGLGIDVDTLVANVEGSFGEYALADGPRRRRRLRSHLPFSANAKAALEGALREARELGDRELSDLHLLLALLVGQSILTEVFGAHEIGYAEVRAMLTKAS